MLTHSDAYKWSLISVDLLPQEEAPEVWWARLRRVSYFLASLTALLWPLLCLSGSLLVLTGTDGLNHLVPTVSWPKRAKQRTSEAHKTSLVLSDRQCEIL